MNKILDFFEYLKALIPPELLPFLTITLIVLLVFIIFKLFQTLKFLLRINKAVKNIERQSKALEYRSNTNYKAQRKRLKK